MSRSTMRRAPSTRPSLRPSRRAFRSQSLILSSSMGTSSRSSTSGIVTPRWVRRSTCKAQAVKMRRRSLCSPRGSSSDSSRVERDSSLVSTLVSSRARAATRFPACSRSSWLRQPSSTSTYSNRGRVPETRVPPIRHKIRALLTNPCRRMAYRGFFRGATATAGGTPSSPARGTGCALGGRHGRGECSPGSPDPQILKRPGHQNLVGHSFQFIQGGDGVDLLLDPCRYGTEAPLDEAENHPPSALKEAFLAALRTALLTPFLTPFSPGFPLPVSDPLFQHGDLL